MAGVSFPSSGRFVPVFRPLGSVMESFANWMDRVLSLLMELPGSLLLQRSVLQLLFFYAERPNSDAFQLLLGPLETPGPPRRSAAEDTRVAAAVSDARRWWDDPWDGFWWDGFFFPHGTSGCIHIVLPSGLVGVVQAPSSKRLALHLARFGHTTETVET
eukprot:g28174.t1